MTFENPIYKLTQNGIDYAAEQLQTVIDAFTGESGTSSETLISSSDLGSYTFNVLEAYTVFNFPALEPGEEYGYSHYYNWDNYDSAIFWGQGSVIGNTFTVSNTQRITSGWGDDLSPETLTYLNNGLDKPTSYFKLQSNPQFNAYSSVSLSRSYSQPVLRFDPYLFSANNTIQTSPVYTTDLGVFDYSEGLTNVNSRVEATLGFGDFPSSLQFGISNPVYIGPPIEGEDLPDNHITYNGTDYYYDNDQILALYIDGDTSYNNIQYVFNRYVLPSIDDDDNVEPGIDFPVYDTTPDTPPTPPSEEEDFNINSIGSIPFNNIEIDSDINEYLQLPDQVFDDAMSLIVYSTNYVFNAWDSVLGLSALIAFSFIVKLFVNKINGG